MAYIIGMDLDFGNVSVVCYPYRTAIIEDEIIQKEADDELMELIHKLSELSESKPDNHVVYEVISKKDETHRLYIGLSDCEVSIGLGINKESW